MKLPIIVLIGQKNVGKSTLFNRLTGTSDALVANYPGLTRDRQYGYLHCKFFKSIIVDTGGINEVLPVNLDLNHQDCVYYQIIFAINEADIILFVVDGRLKETSIDFNIVSMLRKLEKKIFVIINKIDDINSNKHYIYWWGYYYFGIENVVIVSAMHGHGVNNLLKKISLCLEQEILNNSKKNCMLIIHQDVISRKHRIKECLSTYSHHAHKNCIILAVVGCSNVGKSTFINSILGTNRMITSNIPGTTRDSIYTSTVYDHQQYILIDTAGILKKKVVSGNLAEKISTNKTLQVIKDAHIILFMIDANLGILEKDLSALRYVMSIGMSLIIVINKWDSIPAVMYNITKAIINQRISFIEFIQVHFISALYGHGVKDLFHSIRMTYSGLMNMRSINTAQFTRIMRMAVIKRPPPLYHSNIRIKPKYVHVGGYSPLTLVIHGSYVSKLSIDYQRYLKRSFYKYLNIKFAMLHLQLQDAHRNPFIDKNFR